jgi:hypothetical protein
MLDPYSQLPNFFVLGAMRTGTASLAHYLDQHPAICFTVPRDPNFYRKDELYQRGINYYIRSFCEEMNGQPCRGEASPSYFAHPHIIGPRLRAHYKDYPLKFIVLLRDPVSRAWSHYLTRFHQGYEARDFATALDQEIHNSSESSVSYLAEGRYAQILQEWQTYYPLDNFILLLSEDLAAAPLAQVHRTFAWLGVDATVPVNVSVRFNLAGYSRGYKVVNFLNNPPALLRMIGQRIWPDSWLRHRIRRSLRNRFHIPYRTLPPLNPNIAAELRSYYHEDVLTLSKMLGRYLSHWLVDDTPMDTPTAPALPE